jgi:hypothetical protein
MSDLISNEETLPEQAEETAELSEKQIEQVSAAVENRPKQELIAHELTHLVQQDSGQISLGTKEED